jgi:MFS family permease
MGIISFCVGIMLAAVIFSLGFFSDIHANLKALFLLGLLFSGAFNIGMLLVHNFLGALTVRLLHVIGDSAYLIAQRITIARFSEPTGVGGNIGVFDTTTTLGTFVGAFISGLVPGYANLLW